jgi:antitoxin CptB
MREMDMLLGGFADACLHTLTPEQLRQYEALLEASDPDLYQWIAGTEPFPAGHQNGVTELLLKYAQGKIG